MSSLPLIPHPSTYVLYEVGPKKILVASDMIGDGLMRDGEKEW